MTSSAVVVVLPWVPVGPMTGHWAVIASSNSGRRHAGPAAGGFQLGVVVGTADTPRPAPPRRPGRDGSLPHFDASADGSMVVPARRSSRWRGGLSRRGSSPGRHAGSADADGVDSLGDSGHADAISIMHGR